MRVIVKDGILVIAPEAAADAPLLADFGDRHAGHVFHLSRAGEALLLKSMGPEEDACNLPINISSRSPAPLNLISNFASTPFVLDGARYASVEGFWQSLRWTDPEDRRRIAALHGIAAKRAGSEQAAPDRFSYGGTEIRWGTADHWQLMRRACDAKFKQNDAARAALLGTGRRPLRHRTRRDSRSIPGVVMADIWMAIRHHLRRNSP